MGRATSKGNEAKSKMKSVIQHATAKPRRCPVCEKTYHFKSPSLQRELIEANIRIVFYLLRVCIMLF